MLDVADLYGWPPEVIKHTTLPELIFYRTRNGMGWGDRTPRRHSGGLF
jgi:hypothetical protein